MKKDFKQNQLIKTNSFFEKIKKIFRKIFYKSKFNSNFQNTNSYSIKKEDNSFKESIKKIEDEETLILKLQKQFRNGEIKEKDLTEEQINELSKLYHRQIISLRKSNEIRKKRILEYRKNYKFN